MAIVMAQDISLLITDVGLPDMTGLELASKIRKARPTLPIIFSTGDPHLKGADQIATTAILGKPFRDEELMSAIRSLTPGGV
jgi:DNA-binding response OmpR family regulator